MLVGLCTKSRLLCPISVVIFLSKNNHRDTETQRLDREASWLKLTLSDEELS